MSTLLQPPESAKPARRFADVPTGELVWNDRAADELVRRGATAFDVYDEMLDDPFAGSILWNRIVGILLRVDADRTRFVPIALSRLADRDFSTRQEALRLLAHIGGEKDTAPVVALLLDGRTEVRFAAAKTLAAIGGKLDLTAFDLIIRDADRYIHNQYKQPLLHPNDVKHYAECRAKVAKRLEEAEAKAKPPEKK